MNAKSNPALVPEKSPNYHLYAFLEPIREYLDDGTVSEVLINGPKQIYVERKGILSLAPAKFMSEQALFAAMTNVARSIGRTFDKNAPRLDARLPDGSRVHAVMPPLSRVGTVVAIRKFSRDLLTLEKLVTGGSISAAGARLLDIIVKVGRNLLVSGATSSGKTSVLNAISRMVPPNERILVLEDASELQLQQPHTVCFETRKPDEDGKGEITMRELLHSSLRLRPDRIVIGEIRGGEAMDLLQAMNTGHDGTMSTIHANSPAESLVRLENCAMQDGLLIPQVALRAQVASAIQIVIQTARLTDGARRITHISEVMHLDEHGNYTCQDILRFEGTGIGPKGEVEGTHRLTGYLPSFMEMAAKRGLDVKCLDSLAE